MRSFELWCQENQVTVIPNWVKSADMLADGLSRQQADRGDYSLDKKVFQKICHIFATGGFWPQVDMFASPGNHQLPGFVGGLTRVQWL